MERRKFLSKTIAATSACTMAGGVVFACASAGNEEKEVKIKCKITVLKKEHYEDLSQEHKGRAGKPCPLFEVGQEIIVEKWWECPEGFCSWAWADIRPMIQQVQFAESRVSIGCCTDGLRPVVFKIEKVEVEIEE